MGYLNPAYIRRISVWGKIVGIMTMLYGIVSIVVGMLTYYVHIIPGVTSIVLGKMLFDIGQEAKKALHSEEEVVSVVGKVISKYGLYLLFLGILIIIAIIFYIGFFIFVKFLA